MNHVQPANAVKEMLSFWIRPLIVLHNRSLLNTAERVGKLTFMAKLRNLNPLLTQQISRLFVDDCKGISGEDQNSIKNLATNEPIFE